MRAIALLLACLCAAPAAARENRVGVVAGVLAPTRLHVDGHAAEVEPGVVFVFRFERAFAETLDLGAFLQVGSMTAERRDEQVNFFALGLSAHWVSPLPFGGVLRLGGGAGYRQLYADAGRYDRVRGIAVDGEAILSYELAPGFTGVAEAGLLTQPLGSNGRHEVTWLPFPYLAIGAEF